MYFDYFGGDCFAAVTEGDKLVEFHLDSAGASEPSKSSESDASKINLGGEKTSLAFFKKLLQLCGGGGMPVSDALKSLAQRSLDARTKALCRDLYTELSEGRTLSDAL